MHCPQDSGAKLKNFEKTPHREIHAANFAVGNHWCRGRGDLEGKEMQLHLHALLPSSPPPHTHTHTHTCTHARTHTHTHAVLKAHLVCSICRTLHGVLSRFFLIHFLYAELLFLLFPSLNRLSDYIQHFVYFSFFI